MSRILDFCKKEAVLIVSLLLAFISTFYVKPSREYLTYIDFRTLALLFCLMLIMAGLNQLNIFKLLAAGLIQRIHSVRGIFLAFCLLCFFSSMLITNDVALITFVPFTIITLKLVHKTDKLIFLIILETIAANLGSMLIPIGNPQNLYLFSSFNMSGSVFITTILPYALLSLIMIIVSVMFVKNDSVEMMQADNSITIGSNKLVLLYCLLFVFSLLTVFRILPYFITFTVSLILVLIFNRETLANVDYSLLLTFVFLFIFIGNLGNIKPISDFLCSVVSGNEVIAGVLASQIFSNVPAAILLSGFTENISALLIGVNLGGLGTLIASMASLISYKLIIKENIKSSQYLFQFTLWNLIFLFANLGLWLIIK